MLSNDFLLDLSFFEFNERCINEIVNTTSVEIIENPNIIQMESTLSKWKECIKVSKDLGDKGNFFYTLRSTGFGSNNV